MMASAVVDWGRCICAQALQHEWIDVPRTVDGRPAPLTDVPRGRCVACGSRVYRAESLGRVEAVLKGRASDGRLAGP